jgi:phage gpG-like protein
MANALRLRIDALGEEIIDRTLLGVQRPLWDMTGIWDEIDTSLSRNSVRQFASEGAYGSGGWAPLASSTLKRKAHLGQSSKILQATRRLYRSLTVSDHPEHLYVGQPHEMAWGTTVPYAKYHQDGSGSSLPRRRVVQLPETARRNVVRIMQRGILAGSRA